MNNSKFCKHCGMTEREVEIDTYELPGGLMCAHEMVVLPWLSKKLRQVHQSTLEDAIILVRKVTQGTRTSYLIEDELRRAAELAQKV